MKTYKNPELRASSVVKAEDLAKKTAAAPKKAAAPAVKKPPVCELQGQKWIVVRPCVLAVTVTLVACR